MTAPILRGYLCRVCGCERIQAPWNATDGFLCDNCGATNWTPLLSVELARVLGEIVGGS